MPATLYLVATPIGNLEDITLRALRVLKEVDLVAAEDTRHSRKLFAHYGIATPLTSYFAHNEKDKGEKLISVLREGKSVALISDAGMPAIADPGYLLVHRCRQEGIPVTVLPGACALVTALARSGLPSDRFGFEGFLPARAKARREALRQLQAESRTTVFYEAPHRLFATLQDLATELGEEREVAIARELSKMHEELFYGSAAAAIEHFGRERVRGEIVLLVAPAADGKSVRGQAQAGSVEDSLRKLMAEGMRPRQAAKQVAKEFGLPADEVYRLWLEVKDKQ